MELKTFIFIGRSGCGKGTQAELLIEYLKKVTPDIPIQYLETGAQFRELIARSNHTALLARDIMDAGGLQPSFLAVHSWSHLFIENMTGKEHLIIDGSPRRLDEAKVLVDAFRFYHRAAPTLLYINISKKWSADRLLARGRFDDSKKDIEERLSWFDTQVLPAVEQMKKESEFIVHDINGEQTIEKVHQEILSKILS